MTTSRPKRPPLFERLKTGLEEAIEWEKGNGAARVTEFINGERIGPEYLTKAEFEARQSTHEDLPLTYNPEADSMVIHFKDVTVAESDEIMPGVIVNYDQNGNVVGVEILDVSVRIKKTPEAA